MELPGQRKAPFFLGLGGRSTWEGGRSPYAATRLRARGVWTVSPLCNARTDIPYGARCLRACYAMSGTDFAYAARCLRWHYAMSGADIAYAVPGQPCSGACA
eukprot:28317-Rhodomonas_salina.4